MKLTQKKYEIWEKATQKLLDVDMDKSLNFDKHHMSDSRKKNVCNCTVVQFYEFKSKTFIETQFWYCPLVWMVYGGTSE